MEINIVQSMAVFLLKKKKPLTVNLEMYTGSGLLT